MQHLHLRIFKGAFVAILMLGTMAIFLLFASETSADYVIRGYSISQRVVDIPYEKALIDYCSLLNGVQGVTGVSYRDYDVLQKTAIVTVYYDPAITSPEQIGTYLGNTRSIWDDPLRV